ncbi:MULTISPECIES: porin family protein [Flavobacterium]|uniref:porin family protein n=1 Tax=Flavobacterium TaxID=237 RepID=UPI001FCC1E01|nr:MULTISPECIES: porin family protein [Flavobacterium]UOK42494.1 PorT family protein [Flavobacterium enshiense]
MKKVILTVAAVFAFGFANAQDKEMRFGVKGGMNVSTLTGDAEDAKSLVGIHIGGFMEYKINDKFAIQPELLFSMQGAKTEYTDFDGFETVNVEEKYKLNYLNIPIMAKYYANEKLSIEAGPQIGFLLSAKDEVSAYGETVEVDFKDYVKSMDFGLNIGVGYDFTDNIFAGARYNFGLSDINDIDESSDEIHNGVFSLSAGYKF